MNCHPKCHRDHVRAVNQAEFEQVLTIINAASAIYRGHIPDDCFHDPYMREGRLRIEIAAGVRFSGIDVDGQLAAVMGVQQVGNVHLIRHAYVLPEHQGKGLGGELIKQICRQVKGQILVGTWAAAKWAIRFYQAHGFVLVPARVTPDVLQTYWSIPKRQIATSVVLARSALDEQAARALIAQAPPQPRT